MSATQSSFSDGTSGRSRRHVERIRLTPPVSGQLGSTSVTVTDLSLSGAGVEHPGSLPVGAKVRLTFSWNGEHVQIPCSVLRCRLTGFTIGPDRKTTYQTGLAFEGDAIRREHPIRQMIEASVLRALDEQKANARGIRIDESDAGVFTGTKAGSERRSSASRSPGFLCFSLQEGRWRKSNTQSPGQPPEGFTVWATEDPGQLELLCRVYERCDEPMRKMIRILAQLSVTEGDGESQRRYIP